MAMSKLQPAGLIGKISSFFFPKKLEVQIRAEQLPDGTIELIPGAEMGNGWEMGSGPILFGTTIAHGVEIAVASPKVVLRDSRRYA